MLQSIANLRAIADLCQAQQPLPPHLSTWLSSSLLDFLEHRTGSVNEALGIRNARGGVPWWLEAAMRTRDTALRQLATYFPDMSISARAAGVRQLAVRYGASAWRRDQLSGVMPTSYRGTRHEWLWKAFKSGAPMPLCQRQLRKILGP